MFGQEWMTAFLQTLQLLKTPTTSTQRQFDAIGTPFPDSLQPVDPNRPSDSFTSFDRPLRMEEIEAILDSTSRPIKFGQFDYPLRVIEGYINKVDIKSIIKQDASIQLKSNKILR